LFKFRSVHVLNGINAVIITGRYKIFYGISSLSRRSLLKDLSFPHSFLARPVRGHNYNVLCQVEHLLCETPDTILCLEPILFFWHSIEVFQRVDFCPLPFFYQLRLSRLIELCPHCHAKEQNSGHEKEIFFQLPYVGKSCWYH